MSAMVGAPAISRIITEPKRSDAILRAVRDAAIAMKAASSWSVNLSINLRSEPAAHAGMNKTSARLRRFHRSPRES